MCEFVQLMIDGRLVEPRLAKIFLLKYGNPRAFPSPLLWLCWCWKLFHSHQRQGMVSVQKTDLYFSLHHDCPGQSARFLSTSHVQRVSSGC